MKAMQRTIDMISGISTEEEAADLHTRQDAERAGESRDTFAPPKMAAPNTELDLGSVSTSGGWHQRIADDMPFDYSTRISSSVPSARPPHAITSTHQASANDDEIEDDPLDELATMAPLGKMVTEAETVPELRKARTHSFDKSPMSYHSDRHQEPEIAMFLPGDPVAAGLISESRGRKLLGV
jgi:hypothetical protein